MCAPHIKTKLSMPDIELGRIVVPVSTVAKNIGVYFDDALSMQKQVQHICRISYFHLHCIGKIRNLLDRKTTEIMIHSYVTSRLDNRNCLLYGISDHLLTKLQSTKRCCPAHNQNEETRTHHCCFDRSSLASDQKADRVQIVTVDISKPSRTSSSIRNRTTNSLPTDPCATLRGRPSAGGSSLQTAYAGRKGIF